MEFTFLTGANLSLAGLTNANLFNADLQGADLVSAVLNGADLTNADLSGTNLNVANLDGAFLNGANLIAADLSGAFGISTTSGSATYNALTNFTSTGFNPVTAGWNLVVPEPTTGLMLGLGLLGVAVRRRV